MTPDNSHTTAQLFKRIQQKKDEFSDTLLDVIMYLTQKRPFGSLFM